MDQKEQSRIQVPDIDQKVARKVCLRKIRKPYDLVLKAVPNINSLVFHWSSFPCSTSEHGTAGLPCKASVLLYTGWYSSTQITGSICIPNMVSANWKYLQPQYGLIPGSSLPSLYEMVSTLENMATSAQNNVFIMIKKSSSPLLRAAGKW